ncbi:MAG: redox-regulated ATPase YchF [Holosporaceae bacterium]|jgi:GTP-binding protein YchF|nr:redox-regulated ATPase YchF [Holosporaceae bacterium]
MGFNCGIVGLPNVGKSTLFNALTQTAAAQAMNYPFCTLEPNVGRVGVADPRLHKLAEIAASMKIIPTQLEVVDIAGLIKGASNGEGLGNQFLGHIRNTNAILHMVRCFSDADITHVHGKIDPVYDIEVVEMELMLADIENLYKKESSLAKKDNPEFQMERAFLNKAIGWLESGNLLEQLSITEEEQIFANTLHLISIKPVMYVCNVSENDLVTGNDFTKMVQKFARSRNASVVLVSAAVEAEIALIQDKVERNEYLKSLGLEESGLDRVVRGGYGLLKLITFFTCGPEETHAWTAVAGSKAPAAAGIIHSDFERGFICAEVIGYDDYTSCCGEAKARAAGKMRLEGREYVISDGDVIHFRFNV